MSRPTAAAGAALLLALPAPAAERPADGMLSIGIAQRAELIELRAEGAFSIVDQASGTVSPLEAGRPYTVRAHGRGGLRIGPLALAGQARLLPRAPEARVLIDGRKYRGNVLLRPNDDGTVTAVDEVGVEEYLEGVLPKEMSPDWPLEALKAQAVVARTFALKNLGKYSAEGFDLTGDQRSQVYSGLDVESERVRRAVRETAGEVLVYGGALLPAHYHSCCGGKTLSPTAVWGGASAPKPLAGVKDRHCRASPHFQWSAYFATDDILAALNQDRFTAARLEWIRPGPRDAGGRLQAVRLRLDGRTHELPFKDLRRLLGAGDLKSPQVWRIVARRKGFEFIGRGYGHGVGLCQWGARGLAEGGRAYRQILAHYFPGAAVSRREL